MVVRYGQTVTDGQKSHLEISDSKTSETMCHLVSTLFLFMYVVLQKYIVNPAAKMSVHNDFRKMY